MPTCSYCGKEVQADATFCPNCGANLQTNTQAQPVAARPAPVMAEDKMAAMVKRMERISYIMLIASAIVLIEIVILLV